MDSLRLKLLKENLAILARLRHHLPHNDRLRAGWILKRYEKNLLDLYFNELSGLATDAKERAHSKELVAELVCPITTCPKCKAPIRWLQGKRKKIPIEATPYDGEVAFNNKHHVCHFTICSMFGD